MVKLSQLLLHEKHNIKILEQNWFISPLIQHLKLPQNLLVVLLAVQHTEAYLTLQKVQQM